MVQKTTKSSKNNKKQSRREQRARKSPTAQIVVYYLTGEEHEFMQFFRRLSEADQKRVIQGAEFLKRAQPAPTFNILGGKNDMPAVSSDVGGLMGQRIMKAPDPQMRFNIQSVASFRTFAKAFAECAELGMARCAEITSTNGNRYRWAPESQRAIDLALAQLYAAVERGRVVVTPPDLSNDMRSALLVIQGGKK